MSSNPTIRQVLQSFKKTYQTIDLRFLLLERQGVWNSILTSIYLTSKNKQDVDGLHKSIIKNVEAKSNPRAKIVMFTKPISAIDKIIDDLKAENFQVNKDSIRTIGTKNIESLDSLIYPSTYFDEENMVYEFFATQSNSSHVILEKELGKNVFGFDNNNIPALFNIPPDSSLSFLFGAPRYCNIDIKSKNEILITIHKNLVKPNQ